MNLPSYLSEKKAFGGQGAETFAAFLSQLGVLDSHTSSNLYAQSLWMGAPCRLWVVRSRFPRGRTPQERAKNPNGPALTLDGPRCLSLALLEIGGSDSPAFLQFLYGSGPDVRI